MPKQYPSDDLRIKLRERDVQIQVRHWFEWHHWRTLRWNVGMAFDSSGGKVMFGEKGMPDLMFIYYFQRCDQPGASLTVWVETKRPGAKPKADRPMNSHEVDQFNWQQKEMSRGGCVVTIDNFEELRDWYSEHFGWLHKPGAGEGQFQLGLDE